MNDSIAKANKLPLSFEYPDYGKLSFEQDSYSGTRMVQYKLPSL